MPDRKSTRLNSSHLVISYAVFCLKKKKEAQHRTPLRCKTSGDTLATWSRRVSVATEPECSMPIRAQFVFVCFCFFFFFLNRPPPPTPSSLPPPPPLSAP